MTGNDMQSGSRSLRALFDVTTGAARQRVALRQFVSDGRLTIANNVSERTVRIQAVERLTVTDTGVGMDQGLIGWGGPRPGDRAGRTLHLLINYAQDVLSSTIPTDVHRDQATFVIFESSQIRQPERVPSVEPRGATVNLPDLNRRLLQP